LLFTASHTMLSHRETGCEARGFSGDLPSELGDANNRLEPRRLCYGQDVDRESIE
jgi:hypothetical protein